MKDCPSSSSQLIFAETPSDGISVREHFFRQCIVSFHWEKKTKASNTDRLNAGIHKVLGGFLLLPFTSCCIYINGSLMQEELAED